MIMNIIYEFKFTKLYYTNAGCVECVTICLHLNIKQSSCYILAKKKLKVPNNMLPSLIIHSKLSMYK